MPYFTLDGIDFDQSGDGLPRAIPELQGQLPITVNAYRQMAGPDRADYYFGIMERAIKYHPQPNFDWTRTQSDFVGHDGSGQFLAIRAIVICSLFVGTQVHAGMRGFAVRVALVVDNTLGNDAMLAFEKCEYAGQGLISDLPGGPAPVD